MYDPSVAARSHELPSVQETSWVLLEAAHPALGAALSDAHWNHLDALLARLTWERQLHGDAADHCIEVAMLVHNRTSPSVAPGAPAELVDLLAREPCAALFQRLYGLARPLHLRRAQANRMREGDYNRFHRDTDDDPDYALGVILYVSDPADYDGGEIRFEGATEALKAPRRSLVAFRAGLGHELLPMGACRRPRCSVVLLFGEHDGPNRRFTPAAR